MDSQQATRLDTPPFSVARFICEGYEQDPFKQMVVGMNEGITYAEAYRRMLALAAALRRDACTMNTLGDLRTLLAREGFLDE